MKHKQAGFSATLLLAVILVPSFVMGAYFMVGLRSAQKSPVQTAHAADIKEIVETDGQINRIKPSCAQDWVLGGDGQPTQTGDMNLCDVGTFVVVNDIEIQTETGYSVVGNTFSRDISKLKPGQAVKFKYVKTSETTGTLGCEGCYITLK